MEWGVFDAGKGTCAGMRDDIFKTASVEAAIYFLNTGEFLFRWKDDRGRTASKCVAPGDVAAAFTRSEEDSGYLASGVVRTGYSKHGSWYVFFAAPQVVTINLFDDEMITVPIPACVMVGVGREYYIWSIREKVFSPNATAYAAPFPNVNPDGKICFGQNNPPDAHHSKATEIWNLFMQSPFNGDLVTDKSIRFKNDVRKQLDKQAGKNKFPVGDLVSCKITIGSCIGRVCNVR